jgi:hypothetical protein
MSYQVIASGSALDQDTIAGYEDQIAEGQSGILQLNLSIPVSQSILDDLNGLLEGQGIEGLNITVDSTGQVVSIGFTKGQPWLTIIAGIILGLVILAILIVGWSILVQVASAIPGGFTTLFKIGGGALGLWLLGKTGIFKKKTGAV